jgi:hypothetical protein
MEENPVPTEARQIILGPAGGQSMLIFSAEIPVRSGPRHCGQSPAKPIETHEAIAIITQGFMSRLC